MLRRLYIKNFVLIDHVAISFHKGLNVITGETGAGKSVILAALSFLQGARHDASVIRQGAELTTCEATFEIKKNSPLITILHEAGIEFSLDEELILKRELTANGKSRATINNQSASLALLKKIAPHLIEFSGQHAHLLLLEEDAPLALLDAYATLEDAKKTFVKAWHEERNLLKEIQAIEQGLPLRLRNIDICKLEIEEITSARLREGEEEEIFQEFQILTNQEELTQKTSEVLSFLTEGKSAIMPQLLRQKANFERIIEMDPSLTETSRAFISSVAELQEVSYELKRYHIKSNFHPDRLATIDQRLKELSHLKKKYGQTLAEIATYQEAQIEKLTHLENQDAFLEKLKTRHASLKIEADNLAKKLTDVRTKRAGQLEKSISKEICSLNMPNAIFEIMITPKVRSETGDDKVEFFVTPNLGEKRINVQEASGGELARVALALKMVLVDMCEMPTIVFDEIDANIGGTTAALVGEKLSTLGKSVQVISITHFPQVALSADSHFRIQKFEQRGRTHSTVEHLESEASRTEEITRMLGGKSVTYSGT